MSIKRFEDLEVWQDSRIVVNTVYQLTFGSLFSQDYALRDQVRRSAISIMANIAEGFDRNSNKDFVRFLRYSVSSVSESKSHLYIALDMNYITEDQFNACVTQLDTVTKQIKGFIKYLNKHK